MSKETEFVQKAQKILLEARRHSLKGVGKGDVLVVDDQFNIDHGGWHSLRSGDELRVDFIEKNPYSKDVYHVTVKKATDDGSCMPRHKVGDTMEVNEHMPLYDYLRLKCDNTMAEQLKKLCRDYLGLKE